MDHLCIQTRSKSISSSFYIILYLIITPGSIAVLILVVKWAKWLIGLDCLIANQRIVVLLKLSKVVQICGWELSWYEIGRILDVVNGWILIL